MPSEPASRRARLGCGREQLGQVVARDAAGRAREVGGDAGARARPHRREAVGERPAAARRHAAAQVVAVARPERGRLSPGEHAAHAQQPVLGLAVDDRARARRVVADHAADGRLLDGRGVGPELEAVGGSGAVERALHDPGLDARRAALGVDLEDAVEVKAVDRDAGAEGLPGQTRGRAAHAERHAVARRDLGRRRQVVDRARHQHRVGQHPVDRGVGRVQPARQRARAHLAGHVPGKLGGRGQAALAGGRDAGVGAHRAKHRRRREGGASGALRLGQKADDTRALGGRSGRSASRLWARRARRALRPGQG